MTATSRQAELERLASRIAMLVGDDGEAEAAGRAVGVMARRLGLSGGHLKAIFMAGTGSLGAAAKQTAELAARADRLAGQTHGQERSLEQLEFALQQTTEERDALRAEAGRLREALERANATRQLAAIVAAVVLLAVLGGGGFALYASLPPSGRTAAPVAGLAAAPAPGQPGEGAVVRAPGTNAYADADRGSVVRAHLPTGTRLAVRQLVWRNFTQWAETRLGGSPAYVPVTDLDLDR